jgi:hypothetical protein
VIARGGRPPFQAFGTMVLFLIGHIRKVAPNRSLVP